MADPEKTQSDKPSRSPGDIISLALTVIGLVVLVVVFVIVGNALR